MCADGIDERGWNVGALELRVECREPAGIGRAALVDLSRARIDSRQLGDALGEFGFQKIRLQSESLRKMLPRRSDPGFAAQRHAEVVVRRNRIGIDAER